MPNKASLMRSPLVEELGSAARLCTHGQPWPQRPTSDPEGLFLGRKLLRESPEEVVPLDLLPPLEHCNVNFKCMSYDYMYLASARLLRKFFQNLRYGRERPKVARKLRSLAGGWAPLYGRAAAEEILSEVI